MATGIVNLETVWHRKLTGTVLVRNIQINGWGKVGTKFNSFSQNGRLWGEVSGTDVKLYRSINSDGTFTAGEEVLGGSGAAGALITLTESNTSGLDDSYLRYTGAGTFDIVFGFANEEDVLDMVPGDQQQIVWPVIEAQLSKPERLERVLNNAMKKINERLVREMQTNGAGIYVIETDENGNDVYPDGKRFLIDDLGRYELAILANPEQLIRLQVWQVLRDSTEKLLGIHESARAVEEIYSKKWHEEWQNLRLWIDFAANAKHDGNQRVSPVTYKPLRK